MAPYSHEKEMLASVGSNYKKTIRKYGVTDTSLSSYFIECFNDASSLFGLYKCWICVACLAEKNLCYGWGDKPRACPKCGKPTYEVATFQARASHTGRIFQYACVYLLRESYGLDAKITGEATQLYDFEIQPDLVIEAKGSPEFIVNPDRSHSSLNRAGMIRSDTYKKAFANATEWKRRFPSGHFYVLTNSLPNRFRAYKDDKISGILDITKKGQLDAFVAEVRGIIKGAKIS